MWGLVLLLVVGCVAFPPPGYPKAVPHVSVNLDAPPQERWYPVVTALLKKHGYEGSFGAYEAYWDEVPEMLRPLLEDVSASLEKYAGKEYSGEIVGIHKALVDAGYGDRLPLKVLVTLNMFYSLTTGCTSIVAKDPKDMFWHARNMDWDFDGISLTNLTRIVDFTKGGKKVYTTVTWLGYIGALTGYVPNKFSITANERDAGGPLQIIADLSRVVSSGAWFDSLLPRTMLAKGGTFNETLAGLRSAPVAAPIYYIVGGTEGTQGAVLSRSWNESVHGTWRMPDGPEDWYLLETNYDHWQTPPPHDDRRRVGDNAMHTMGRENLNYDNLFRVLQTRGDSHTRGTFNEITVYTAVMSVAQDFIKAWVWQ